MKFNVNMESRHTNPMSYKPTWSEQLPPKPRLFEIGHHGVVDLSPTPDLTSVMDSSRADSGWQFHATPTPFKLQDSIKVFLVIYLCLIILLLFLSGPTARKVREFDHFQRFPGADGNSSPYQYKF